MVLKTENIQVNFITFPMHTALQQFDVKVAQRSTFYLQLVTEIISGAPAELSSVFHRTTEREYQNATVWRNVSGKLG